MRSKLMGMVVVGAVGASSLAVRSAAGAQVGYWDFSQASGLGVADGSGKGHDATLGPDGNTSAQAPALLAGSAAGLADGQTVAVFTSASQQYVNITGGGGLNNLTTGTISMSVNWTSNNEQAGASDCIYGAVMGRQSGGNFSSDLIGLDGSDPNSAHIVFWGASTDTTRLTSITSPGLNQWHNLSIVFQGGSQQLYIDGTLDATLNNGVGAVGNDATVPLTLGAWTGDGASYSDSMIRNVAVWDTALSPSEIATWNSGAGINTSSTPEPASFALLAAAASVGLLRRRRTTADACRK